MNIVNDYQPVIIIGAGRSGTNMLRDILTQIPGLGTWQCDEINYIWRHGNLKEDNDEFSPELATADVLLFVHKAFELLARKSNLSHVIEKTCANSLRVGFINQIFPNAKFIWIVRDGRDVVASAHKRWTASLNLPYILQKARFVPLLDIPHYASRYLWNRVYRLISGEHRLAFWGPRFKGMNEVLKQYSLVEVCAIQWRRCIEKAEQDLSAIESERVLKLRYEDFVYNPQKELIKINDFLGVCISEKLIEELVQEISVKSVGNWISELNTDDLNLIQPLIWNTLTKHGYQC